MLSACDSGITTRQAGDELQGLSAALLSLGTRSLVAAMIPVEDEVSRRLMVRFHVLRAAGLGPAAALAEAQREICPGRPQGPEASALGFRCFGAG